MKNMKSSVLSVCVLAILAAGCKTAPDNGAGQAYTIKLTVQRVGAAGGTVSSNLTPDDLACGAACTTVTTTVAANASVTLTAAPNASSYFLGWDGYLGCGAVETCTVTATAGKTINLKANFSTTLSAGDVAILTPNNKIVTFNYADPGTAQTAQTITGLAVGDSVVGIDYIPASLTGSVSALIALSTNAAGVGKLFLINPATGAVGALHTLVKATAGDAYAGLEGTRFGIDYNPVKNNLRIVSDTGQNLSVTVDLSTTTSNALVTTDGTLAVSGSSAPDLGVVSAAYTNNYLGSKGTILYVINKSEKKLYVQNNDTGSLYGIASISVPFGTLTDISDFDMKDTGTGDSTLINPSVNPDAVFVGTLSGNYALYHLNIATGVAELVSGPVVPQQIPTPLAGAVNPLSEGALSVAVKPGAIHLPGDSYAVNDLNELITFNRATPGTILSRNTIPRLYSPTKVNKPSSDHLLGIDLNPVNGILYGVSMEGGLYTIDRLSGLGSYVADLHLSASPTVTQLPQGSGFGVDFNPVDGTLHLLSNGTSNWTIDVGTGVVTMGAALHRGSGASSSTARLTEAAYDSNLPAAAKATLYAIDTTSTTSAVLTTVNTADGTVTNVGSLGIAASDLGDFDIDGLTGNAYAALNFSSGSHLYLISLVSGAATDLGTIGSGRDNLIGLTVKLPKVTVYGLTSDGKLIGFDPANAAAALPFSLTITGTGEKLVTLDFRAADSKLFGVTASGKIFSIALTTSATTGLPTAAVATFIKTMTNLDDNTMPVYTSFGSATDFGSDFDPKISPDAAALRIVASGNPAQNLRVNVVSGSTFSDGNLNVTSDGGGLLDLLFPTPSACADSGSPTVGGIAFSNDASQPASVLYGINRNTSCLYKIAANGAMGGIGQLGVTLSSPVMGFDIAGVQDGLVLAALDTGGAQSNLFSINLATGAATARGAIGPAATPKIAAMTIAVQPSP